MNAPDQIRDLIELFGSSIHPPISDEDYRAFLAVLSEDMSEEHVALVASNVLGMDPELVANDAAAALSVRKPSRSAVDQMRQKLMSSGWDPDPES